MYSEDKYVAFAYNYPLAHMSLHAVLLFGNGRTAKELKWTPPTGKSSLGRTVKNMEVADVFAYYMKFPKSWREGDVIRRFPK